MATDENITHNYFESFSTASPWQPIETAPKDRALLSYHGAYPQFIGWIEGEGWCVLMPPARGMGFNVHGNFAPFHPTHWMPIPEPPR